MRTGLFVIMGVAGSGKTTIGELLARALGIDFLDADDLHPRANVERMAAGIPLTDADRKPWLEAIAAHLAAAKRTGRGLVVACSALKRSYRDVLRSAGDVQFIYLTGTKPLLRERMAQRRGHFMPAGLLDSQLATLEPPGPDESAWVCDISEPPEAIVAALVARASSL